MGSIYRIIHFIQYAGPSPGNQQLTQQQSSRLELIYLVLRHPLDSRLQKAVRVAVARQVGPKGQGLARRIPAGGVVLDAVVDALVEGVGEGRADVPGVGGEVPQAIDAEGVFG